MVRKIAALLGWLVLLLPTGLVLAGGWVVITVDELPGAIRAGETAEISFMVRAHGRTPTHGVSPLLSAWNEATGEWIEVAAEPAADVGRFTTTILFPSAGEWRWSISAQPYPQRVTMAPLTVVTAASAPVTPSPVLDWQLMLGWAGLILLATAGGVAVLGRRRQPGDVVAAAD
ncbi:MAG: hypothetical protein R3300_01440 [Candidatus Promineifilaceae bacterium]|nr:hypothetical protein [Candidatus Promineifilaceae bacterium]